MTSTATRTSYTTRTGQVLYAPLCPVCKTRECSSDGEGGYVSFFSTCYDCFQLVAAAPYCYAPACSSRVCGTRTSLIGATATTTTADAQYACPNGCGTATATGWAVGSARQSATHDAQAKLDGGQMAFLVDTRLVHIGRDVDAEHPVRRAYARAYVATAQAVLAAG